MHNKIHFILKTIFIFFFLIDITLANIAKSLIKKINTTETLSFNFTQIISEKKETGKCYVKYPKLLMCDYNDAYEKRLISNGRTIAIIQKRYKKIFYYPLKTTPLNTILDKKFLKNFINSHQPTKVNGKHIMYEIKYQNKNKLIILFDNKTFNLIGWKTIDIYNNEVQFLITNLKVNPSIDEKIFIIPDENKL